MSQRLDHALLQDVQKELVPELQPRIGVDLNSPCVAANRADLSLHEAGKVHVSTDPRSAPALPAALR